MSTAHSSLFKSKTVSTIFTHPFSSIISFDLQFSKGTDRQASTDSANAVSDFAMM